MSERNPYIRRQDRLWWAKKPYRSYSLRELSGVGVALYAFVLLAGLRALSQGPDAYAGFMRWLSGPAAMVLHLTLLIVMVLHAVTWFQALPKTMPRIVVGGRLIAQRHLTALAFALAILCSASLVIGALP